MLLGIVTAAVASVVLVGQFGRWHQLLDQFNALLSILLPILALTLAVAVRMKDRASILIAAIGLLVGGFQLASDAIAPLDNKQPVPSQTIKTLTLSTYHSNPTPAEIARVLKAETPDIVMLQETSGTSAKVVDALLPGYHRIRSCRQKHCPLTILSRWPITEMPLKGRTPGLSPGVFIGEVIAPIGTFRVMNVHLKRPYHDQAQILLAETAKLAGQAPGIPLIVGGDFNTATGTFGLAAFARDSKLRLLNGFVPTYPANQILPAFAGIDHIFASLHWASSGCHRTSAGGSDHYGISCQINLKGKN